MEDAGGFWSEGFRDSAAMMEGSMGREDLEVYEQEEVDETVEEHLESGEDAREEGGVGRRYARS